MEDQQISVTVRRTCFIGAALQPKRACLAMLVIDGDDHSDWLGAYPD